MRKSVKRRAIRRRQIKTKQNKTKQNKTKQNGGDETVKKIEDSIIESMRNFNVRTIERTEVEKIESNTYLVKFACSKFRVDYNTNSLHIVHLSKCGDLSGTKILYCIIFIGRLLRMNKIKLYDVSNINTKSDCEYSLAKYYILLTGKSWYNSFGFVSNNHNSNIKYNEEIRNMNLESFFDNILYYNYIIDVLSKNEYHIHDLTVRDAIYYLTQIMKFTRGSCNDVAFAIKRIVDSSERKLLYDGSLQLQLQL
jgi:hypothetical protein